MKLPKDLVIALAKYYSHRAAANLRASIGKDAHILWLKQPDLDHISEVAAKHNWGMCAAAGSFWFAVKSNKVLYCHEGNYTENLSLNTVDEVKK
jgi:hypothetical protein